MTRMARLNQRVEAFRIQNDPHCAEPP
jgi:hypothetical protein